MNKKISKLLYTKPFYLIGLFMLVFGLCFLITSLAIYSYYYSDKFVECDYGFIIEDLDDYDERTTFKYTDNDGVYHEVTINSYSSTWAIGSNMLGEYEINNPEHILILDTYITLYSTFFMIGIVFAIIGLILVLAQKRKDNLAIKCKTKGTKIIAKVLETFESNSAMGHIHSQYLTCAFNYKGEGMVVRSQNSFTHDLCKSFHDFDQASMSFVVNVYVLDRTKYYVDLDSLRVNEIDL